MKLITKRNGEKQEFNFSKIENAVKSAFAVKEKKLTDDEQSIELVLRVIKNSIDVLFAQGEVTVEAIQDCVEKSLMSCGQYEVAKSYILYREKKSDARFINSRIKYMTDYSSSSDNAATISETDPNANISMKNVANLEGEVYKNMNRLIQRQRMKDKLNEMFPEVAKQYEKDLNDHIIYVHDEASTPTLKYYCQAISLYPLMCEGVGNIDGVTPGPPNDLQSFSGQLTNLIFLISAQSKGAVAFGEYLIALSYYVEKEFGDNWWNRLDEVITTSGCVKAKTIRSEIRKSMKQLIYGVNQPAGNRSYNSPFTNVSIYDKTFYDALFEEFRFPDGTSPKWEAVDCLQRVFMQLRRDLALIKPLTFPVTTVALVNDGNDIIDQEYKKFCAEEWSKGSSHFCFNSNSPTSLASCCRVLNELTENTFSSINGLQGIMTGSCNVITLNLNRIVQDFFIDFIPSEENAIIAEDKIKSRWNNSREWFKSNKDEFNRFFKEYLTTILERVYKYHIAFKTMLYDEEDKGMFASSNGNYIYMKKLYSTVGLIGYQEAAMFLGLDITNNDDYFEFLQLILSTVKEQNKLHSIHDKKRPFLMNSEAIPGENIAVKFYKWDSEDGYYVPTDRNLYASYFFNPWDNTSVIDKLKLHGKRTSLYADGGQAAHINLEEHLSQEQYEKLIDISTKEGANYFTFNIPLSECKDCGHVVNAPITVCPKCNSTKIDWWTRIIGYLRPISA